MGKIRLSLALMLLAAVMVLLAGGRMARREEVKRTEVDRELVQSFGETFQGEVNQLTEVFIQRLEGLVSQLEAYKGADARELIQKEPAIRSAFLYRQGKLEKEWETFGRLDAPSAPQVVVEGGRQPLNPDTAVTLNKEFFDEAGLGDSGWLLSGDNYHRFYWSCPRPGKIVILLLDFQLIETYFFKRLRESCQLYFDGLSEAGEMVVLESEKGEVILETHDEVPGRPAAMVDFYKSSLGSFWLKGWNQMEEEKSLHQPTLMMAGLLSLSLMVAGVLLYRSQVVALIEAKRRVSFVNRVSHELGTPLTNMTLNLELASRSLRAKPEAAGERLEKVREEVARLSRLVTNVLTYSRRERGKLDSPKVPCQPDEVVAAVIEQFKPAMERREIEIDWQRGDVGTLKLDADGLSQIVWNLISNVEKYAASGKWLGISTRLQEEQLIVDVRDRGEGISGSKRERIFEDFRRVHEKTSEGVSGTGLGLSISRDLANSMGGQLNLIESSSGAHFQLIVPVNAS